MSWEPVTIQHIVGFYQGFILVKIYTCNPYHIPKPHNHKGYIVQQGFFK